MTKTGKEQLIEMVGIETATKYIEMIKVMMNNEKVHEHSKGKEAVKQNV